MATHRSPWLLLLVVSLFGLGCAHESSVGAGAAGAPLGIVDCDSAGDVYSSGNGPCSGFLYGDYDQYPTFVPVARSEVTRASGGDRTPRTVDFSESGSPSSSSATSSGSGGSSGSSSSTIVSSPPRMEVMPASPSAAPVVVSRH